MNYTPRHIDICYLHAISHGAEVRFKEYPEAKGNEGKWNLHRIDARNETMVNYGKIGLGSVYRNFYPTPITIEPIPSRVFGVGLHKTATTSLHKAFQIMGFDSLHWGSGEAPLIWQEVNSAGRSKALERFYAACDLPIPMLYKRLDVAYPGSKFILTVRDESKWLKSVERLWDRNYNPTRWEWDVWPISNNLHRALYGRVDFDAETMLTRYRRHNAEVREYFKDRPGDLLVMDMESGAGWLDLCPFLGTRLPNVPYPIEYVTKTLQSQQESLNCPSQ
jgi:hypothetical protein